MEAAYLIFNFLKKKKRELKCIKWVELPVVTVQLPIFNEIYVAERLINSVCALDYPKDKIEIQVLDDSTDETKQICKNIVEKYKKYGHNIFLISQNTHLNFYTIIK